VLLPILGLLALSIARVDLQSPSSSSASPEKDKQSSLTRNQNSGSREHALTASLRQSYARLPLSFEPNRGQADPRVNFVGRAPGYSLFLTSGEAVLRVKDAGLIRMKLAGSNPRSSGQARDQLPGTSNYFVGNDPVKWRTRIPQYGRVRYPGVYPGVDLVYYGNQRQLEFDFVVAAGADPRPIKLQIQGAQQLRIDSQGDLVLRINQQELRWKKPVAYQKLSGAGGDLRREVASRFILIGKNTVGFRTAEYDRSRTLIIDPSLVYSTFLGGSGDDLAPDIAVDASGNAYVTGSTDSADFRTTSGAFQRAKAGFTNAFVTKFNAEGSLIYSTYLGGGTAVGVGIAVDASGNAYVTGSTGTAPFPTTSGAFQKANAGIANAFVTKLNADGSGLVYSTYLGGSSSDAGTGIAVDASGNAYVAGGTVSTNFPTTSGAFQTAKAGGGFDVDAFVTKLNAAGSGLVYSTYLGDTVLSDIRIAIAIDSAGSAYVTGGTASTNFPTTRGVF